mmetsp:Transcript_25117/g.43354  ORF Transcript_25117/g.43354 Transcript_25117/m.43354 type:complete len:137 (+) Transcript_25117:278-688(+)
MCLPLCLAPQLPLHDKQKGVLQYSVVLAAAFSHGTALPALLARHFFPLCFSQATSSFVRFFGCMCRCFLAQNTRFFCILGCVLPLWSSQAPSFLVRLLASAAAVVRMRLSALLARHKDIAVSAGIFLLVSQEQQVL